MQTEYCVCLYHSARWMELVEQGWITVSVYRGTIATLIRQH